MAEGTLQAPKPRKKKVSCLNALLKFDEGVGKSLSENRVLIGIDEVGRGSLIGPVVAAAVCMPPTFNKSQREALRWLNDSKKLTQKVRAELAQVIQEICITGMGQADKEEVDRLNVHHASLLAAYRAFTHLKQAFIGHADNSYLLLLDGRATIPQISKADQRAFVKGDGLSARIAAASVIAKHARDSYILELAEVHTGYGWETNMGYGTAAHLEKIAQLGVTPHHRQSFKVTRNQPNAFIAC